MSIAYRTSAAVATALLGLMAGFFFAFAIDVAPAMRELDAHGYITTQQSINKAVRNLPFALAYFGSALIVFMPTWPAWRSSLRGLALGWLAASAICFFAAVLLLALPSRAGTSPALQTA